MSTTQSEKPGTWRVDTFHPPALVGAHSSIGRAPEVARTGLP